MGTFETILMLILSVGILIGVYYVLKIILGYVLCALLFGFIFGVIGLIAGYFISMVFFPSRQQSSRRNGKEGKKQDICP